MDIEKCGMPVKTRKALERKKITTTEEYLDITPIEYVDLQTSSKLTTTNAQGYSLIKGTVMGVKCFSGKVNLIKMWVKTIDGEDVNISWFNQEWLRNTLVSYNKKAIVVYGKLNYDPEYGYQMNTPEFINLESAVTNTIYARHKKIPGITVETAEYLWKSLNYYTAEKLEYPAIEKLGLWPKQKLYESLHFPETMQEANRAMKEKRVRDLLYFSINLKSMYPKQGNGVRMFRTNKAEEYIRRLPYELTDGQKETIDTIKDHAARGKRMHLLVQGDVGCGKTTTAFYAALMAVENNHQAVILAPTTVLAKQHYDEMAQVVAGLFTDKNIAYLSGETKASEKRKIFKGLKDGSIHMVVGTHAVFSSSIEYKDLALIVIDEEHKFGVKQREALKEKAERGAHVISMSATPIPRTLATVLYGDSCELQLIRTMPKGRVPIKTCITSSDAATNRFLEKQLSEGRQVYVVCPRVETDEKTEKESVSDAARKYRNALPEYQIGVLHGKMKKADIEETIRKFKDNEIQVLISTTVVEVGVNVPNASVIVIENAEMFGLASLHQLRGRVGRGKYASYCVLKSQETDNDRLRIMCETTDGYKIAEEDLKIRGTGNLISVNQTGYDKYIDLLLAYPDEYQIASETADWMLHHGYTNLIDKQQEENV